LNTDAVLNKTRSGKTAASSQTAPEQPSIPKKKRKTTYVTREEEEVEAATDLVTREVKGKKAEDAAALQKALEVAKETEIPASSFAREDAVTYAQEVVKATEDLQELAASEVGNMLMVVSAGGDAQKDQAAGSEATTGNPDFSHTDDVIEVESHSTPSTSSQSTSSLSSSEFDDAPLGKLYPSIQKGLSSSTKNNKNPADNTPHEPVRSDIDERIIGVSQRKTDFYNRFPANNSLKPPMIQPLNVVLADTEFTDEHISSESSNPNASSSSQPTSTNQTQETSVLYNLVSHYSDELPEVRSTIEKASEVNTTEVTLQTPPHQAPNQQMTTTTSLEHVYSPKHVVPEHAVPEQLVS
jgi:hypothetical protein